MNKGTFFTRFAMLRIKLGGMSLRKSLKKPRLMPLALSLVMVWLAVFGGGCSTDGPAFYIGDEKILYAVPQGFSELNHREDRAYLSNVGDMLASSGVILAAYFVADAQDSELVEGKAALAGDYSMVAFHEGMSFVDVSPNAFQAIIREVEELDDAMVGEAEERSRDILKGTEGVHKAEMQTTKPKLMHKAADSATFYQRIGGTLNEHNQEVMFLMTFVYLDGKVCLVYHYRPLKHIVSLDDFFEDHQKLLREMDLRKANWF